MSLHGANLTGASLQGADLSNASLQGADLTGASLQGANLTEASLQGANLTEASLQGANLYTGSLQGAHLAAASLQGADLTGASLQGADLIGAKLQGAMWKYSILDLNSLGGASISPLSVDEVELIVADLEIPQASLDEVRQRLKGRVGRLTHPVGDRALGFAPKRCYGLDLKDCFKGTEWAEFARQWAVVLADLACSPGDDVQAVAYGVGSYANIIANLDPSAAQAFATRLLDPSCAGRAGLTEAQVTGLQALAGATPGTTARPSGPSR